MCVSEHAQRRLITAIKATEFIQGNFPRYLEAVESYEEPQDVVGPLKDSEDSQIPHHPLHARVLQQQINEHIVTFALFRPRLEPGSIHNPNKTQIIALTEAFRDTSASDASCRVCFYELIGVQVQLELFSNALC